MIQKLGRVFANRWVRTGIGVLVVSLLVWFFGGLLGFGAMHPFETELVRLLSVAGLVVLWLVWNLLQGLRANRRDTALAAGITASGPDGGERSGAAREAERASSEEVAVVGDRLTAAMATLKTAKLGGSGKRLSQLPWYMFIGPPGAGKTTALINSGLKFPLADKEGPAALRGVGGTRNCDWWFTDEAVLIDTAGRYTTQDSHSEVDSAGWLGFLRLLKQHRRRQPINGVIVAISLSDLSLLSDEERMGHAKAIRRRVRELHDELGVRPPVYVLFTKADLVAGFVEFFDNMGKEEREQVWGATFALDDAAGEAGAVDQFGAEFDLLLARLNDRMLERVHQEPDIRRRRLIFGFPQQIASLREVAHEFLAECFRPSRLEPRSLLRGVYFTSGTQDGTPIDRLLGTMAAEFGLPRQAVTSFSGTGRSYFLTRLVREVIFGEAALVSTDPKVERRMRWTHRGAYAGAVVVLLGLGAAWATSFFGNRELIGRVEAATASYGAQFAELGKRGNADADLRAVLPPVNTLRGMPGGYGERDASTPIGLTFGLYQGAKLGGAASQAYVDALNRLLLPRLISRIETQIAASMGNVDVLYQSLKVYLILGRRGPLDRELVTQWLEAQLLAAYPGEDAAPLRGSIMQHVTALLAQPLQAIPLNEPLVAQARAVLTKEPLAEYSYNRVMRSKRVRALPVWSVAENGGAGAGRVFEYRSGKPLNTGVPGIYTVPGYTTVFQPLLALVSQDVAEDSWVLGREKRDVAGQMQDATKLRRDVMGLYLDDYTRRWDALLADIAIKPFNSVQNGLDQMSLLSAPSSPLRDVLTAVDAQTQLNRPSPAAGLAGAAARAGQAAADAGAAASLKQNELMDVLGQANGGSTGKPVDPAQRVNEHFKPLHDWVSGTPEKPAPLEAAIGKIAAIYQSFNQAANAPSQGQALVGMVGGGTGGASAAQQLQDLSRSVPPVVAPMLQTVSRSAAQVTASGASAELSEAWRTKVVPLCETALHRYPLVQSSPTDVQIDDFVALLGPGGQIEKFFDQYLKPFVDTTQRPWKWQSAERTPLGLSLGSLAEFERAAQIREALFPAGGTALQVKFQLNPVNLDPSVGQISVDIGGTTLVDNHGPVEPVQFQWPGPNGRTQVRTTMTPASGANADVRDFAGPWALLRMLDSAKLTATPQPDKFRIAYAGGGGTATMDLIANSVRNPFNLPALRSFRCPAKL
ncbi:MAG: type VI secretion system membrane subunit TssM [Acetobacteraceae bacterium]